ncbi:MAG: hypothetical protein Q8P81_02145 [Nanoarchaeota archaeon]|nr:hypothetical protein [Nanoarchaeota archaeon]
MGDFWTVRVKRGELTTKQLVTLIVLITSFIIILFLLSQLNLGEASNREICHNSVVLRDKTESLAGTLDCRTEYVCVSGGGDCEGLASAVSLGVELNQDSEKIKNETMNAIADQMVSCWWMFGEGKVNYASRSASDEVSCSVCSIVEFDSEMRKIESISYGELYDYLRTAKKSESQTYLQYLYGTNTLENFEERVGVDGYLGDAIDFDEQYFVLTGISSGVAYTRYFEGHVPVVFMEKTKENYDKIECDLFLTKS